METRGTDATRERQGASTRPGNWVQGSVTSATRCEGGAQEIERQRRPPIHQIRARTFARQEFEQAQDAPAQSRGVEGRRQVSAIEGEGAQRR